MANTSKKVASEVTLQVAVAKIKGASPLLFGRQIDQEDFPKKAKETHDAYEKRTWRERCHHTSDGKLYVPAFALKRMLENTAKYKGDKIKGQGQKTWTAKFRAGLQVENDMILTGGAPAFEEVPGMWKSVPSDGKSGGAKRVKRCFPIVQDWSGEVRILLLDPFIQRDVVEDYLRAAGVVNGLGTWRPQNGGNYGRFSVESVEWSELEF
jgi:hypothetical protein